MKKDMEQRLESEKMEMLKRSKGLEEELKLKIETETQRMAELLSERDKMYELLQSEKEKAEKRIAEERKLFEEKISELAGNFKHIETEKSKVGKVK